MKTLAAEFDPTFLAAVDEVQAGETVQVTKNGRPIAKLVPLGTEDDPLAIYRFPGGVEIVGDIMAPLYTDEEYEEFFERSCEQLKK